MSIINYFLFPEYIIYKIAIKKVKQKQNRDLLLGVVTLWIILKLGIILGTIVHFLFPYVLPLTILIGPITFVMVAVTVISTTICLERVLRHG